MSLPARLRWRGTALLVAFVTMVAAFAAAVPEARAFASVPHGVPPRPPAPASPDPSLSAHALTAAPQALDEPGKGFAQYYFAGSDESANVYPHSIQWSYFGLSEVMSDASNCANLDWTVVDKALTEIASYGNSAAIRFYIEYPGGTGTHPGMAVPHCFDGHVSYRQNTYWGTTSPDYDSPYLLNALDKFIAAFAARYDGDPRIAYVQTGLVGLWGEWHTWPFNGQADSGGYPDFMPTNADASRIIDDFANDFHRTKVEVRYPTSGGGAADGLNIGYHDDSFCYREGSPLKGVTLPQSLGGADYAQLQLGLDVGAENKWVTDSMGGEVRPEIQSSAFTSWPGGSGQVDAMQACIELEHTTWKLDQTSQSYSATDPNVAAAVREMGYNLSANNAYYTGTASGSALLGVQISNTGVAPFYYPWTVTVGLQDSAGNTVKTWDTPWDLRTVMPLKIRAFPDWNAGADPTYLAYGYPQYFQTAVDLAGVPAGSYQWVMKVDNPSPTGKTLRFANVTQNTNGWLGLGAVTVNAATAGSAPAAPTALTAAATASTVGLSWTAPSGSVAGYEVFRDGTQIATTQTASYTDPFLPVHATHSYTVEAFTATGALSAASAAASATTSSTDTTAPAAPSGLASPSHDGDSVTLTWTNASDGVGVAGYQVFRNGAQIGTTPLSTYTDLPLASGTQYSYTIKAVDAAGNVSAATAALAVTTGAGSGDSTAPSVPTGLTVQTQAGTSVALGWTASTDAVGVAGYQVFRNGTKVGTTSATVIGNASVPTPTLFTDTGLTPGTSYTYTVKAFDAAGNVSGASAAVTGTTAPLGSSTAAPGAPTGLASPSQTTSSVALSWTAATAGSGGAVTGYDVYRNGAKVGTSTSTSYTDSGLTASTQYSYSVDAFDAAGDTSAKSATLTVSTAAAPCNGDCVPPSAPAGLIASAETASTIGFSWTASTDNTGVTGYKVLRDGTQAGTTTATSFTDTGLTAAGQHSYTVQAVDAAGNVSAASGALSVATTATGTTGYEAESRADTLAGGAALAPASAASGGLAVGYVGNGGTLTFPGVSASTAGRYTVTVAYIDGDAGRSATLAVNGAASTLTFPGTNDGNWNRVQTLTTTVSLNASGTNTLVFSNPGGWAPDFDQITVAAGGGGGDTTAPSVPTGLAASSRTSGSIGLTWTASTDNVGVAGYQVLRNGTQVGTTTTASFTDVGLTASTQYSYTVKAYDAAGNVSAASAALSVSTTAASSATTYEADAAANVLAGGAKVMACAACADGHDVGYVGNGGTLTFTGVTKAAAGGYTLTIVYVDGDAGRSATVTVNGVATTVTFPGTNDGNWNNVQTTSVTVNLSAGTNSIVFSNPGGWAPDLSTITV